MHAEEMQRIGPPFGPVPGAKGLLTTLAVFTVGTAVAVMMPTGGVWVALGTMLAGFSTLIYTSMPPRLEVRGARVCRGREVRSLHAAQVWVGDVFQHTGGARRYGVVLEFHDTAWGIQSANAETAAAHGAWWRERIEQARIEHAAASEDLARKDVADGEQQMAIAGSAHPLGGQWRSTGVTVALVGIACFVVLLALSLLLGVLVTSSSALVVMAVATAVLLSTVTAGVVQGARNARRWPSVRIGPDRVTIGDREVPKADITAVRLAADPTIVVVETQQGALGLLAGTPVYAERLRAWVDAGRVPGVVPDPLDPSFADEHVRSACVVRSPPGGHAARRPSTQGSTTS